MSEFTFTPLLGDSKKFWPLPNIHKPSARWEFSVQLQGKIKTKVSSSLLTVEKIFRRGNCVVLNHLQGN